MVRFINVIASLVLSTTIAAAQPAPYAEPPMNQLLEILIYRPYCDTLENLNTIINSVYQEGQIGLELMAAANPQCRIHDNMPVNFLNEIEERTIRAYDGRYFKLHIYNVLLPLFGSTFYTFFAEEVPRNPNDI